MGHVWPPLHITIGRWDYIIWYRRVVVTDSLAGLPRIVALGSSADIAGQFYSPPQWWVCAFKLGLCVRLREQRTRNPYENRLYLQIACITRQIRENASLWLVLLDILSYVMVVSVQTLNDCSMSFILSFLHQIGDDRKKKTVANWFHIFAVGCDLSVIPVASIIPAW